MVATMMQLPMSVSMILRHGCTVHRNAKVSTFHGEGFIDTSFAEVASRAQRLAGALSGLGIVKGDRVGSFCWNHQQHLEAYLAIPSMGAILHTINVRYSADQIAYTIEHAGDRIIIVDFSLLPLLETALLKTRGVERLIVVGGPRQLGADVALDYEDLIAGGAPIGEWPELPEDHGAIVCYTSGTTGAPKGVVYSHRSIFMHTLCSLGVDTFAISQADRILLAPSMFHSNAWGLPFSAWLAGADLIMPRSHLQVPALITMIESKRPTFTAMVPTLINDLLNAHASRPIDMSSFRVIVSGGSAVSAALIRAVRNRWSVPVMQGWGMTETSPLCCLAVAPRDVRELEAKEPWLIKSGRPVPGVQVRALSEAGSELERDGATSGSLEVRGPWITGAYHRNESPESFAPDGWLRTADVGTIDADNYVQVTDRAKDVIKSGGEWISSVALEGILSEHERVHEVAVIGIPDARWEERPLAILSTPLAQVAYEELRAFLGNRVPRFWIPEYWASLSQLPRTSVGKIDKRALRELVESGELSCVRVEGG